MIEGTYPVRNLFHALTERGLERQNLKDEETVEYITNMLTEFVDTDKLSRFSGETEARTGSPYDYYKHLGDLTLFNLGLYPEHLTYGRHTVSLSVYLQQGRRSYKILAAMDRPRTPGVFRKLSDQFEQCVVGLNWVKLYINDPFYQYVFREFGVT